MVLEKTLESPLDCKTKPVTPKRNQFWIFFGRKVMTNLDSILKSRGHIWMWELDRKESWAPKNWCFWTVVLEKTLESPHCKEIQPVHPKGSQSWVFIGRTDAEAEAPIFWPPDAKSWFVWKDPDARKDWGQEEKRVTEYEMVGWHHWFNGHESEQTPGDGEGQRSLECCSSWGHNESDTTKQLNSKYNNAHVVSIWTSKGTKGEK